MCGIVAYIGEQDATPIVINGLKKLEYRGYDSAGIAVISDGKIEVRRDAGKIRQLEEHIAQSPLSGKIGIGHTRWATHGAPSQQNAHPHLSANGRVVVVHNGIVENYLTLRDELMAEGVVFRSETDTETIAHLIEKYYTVTADLTEAVRLSLRALRGAHGLVVMSADEPDRIIAARLGNAGGVAIGLGEGENFVASDIPAIVEHTRRMIFLESGELAVVTRSSVEVQTLDGTPVDCQIQDIPWDPVSAEKGNYRHFMQKEIHEQVRAISDTLIGRVDFDQYRITLDSLNLSAEAALGIQKIFITACGTAAHAGMVGKFCWKKSPTSRPKSSWLPSSATRIQSLPQVQSSLP